MCPWLTGWLTLMLKLDGVEMIFAETADKAGRINQREPGLCAQRIPWDLKPDPWREVDASAKYERRGNPTPHRLGLEHDPYNGYGDKA